MSEFSKSFQARIASLQLSISSAQDELNKLRKVYTKFPDINVTVNRRGPVQYFSKSVNSIAEDVQFVFSYGELIACPFISYNEIKIHSDPLDFYVASGSESYVGYDFHLNWLQLLRDKNISETVIEKINAYRLAHLPDPYDDLEPEEIEEILSKRNE